MPSKRGLGKGIDVLIPGKEKSNNDSITKVKEVVKEVDTIDINKIEPNGQQPRKNFDEDSLNDLADSIKQHGMIEPLIVKKTENGFYNIIAGERRWRAARIAGLKKVPVIVKDYTSQQIMEVALIENLQREDLNPIEEAEAFQRLIDEYHLKQDEVAEKVSKSRVAITNSLRLLKLDERVRCMVIEEKIKSGHARALLSIEDNDLQYEIAVKVFDEKLSVRETEKLVRKVSTEGKIKKVEKKEVFTPQEEMVYKQYEEKMKVLMGTKVSINHKTRDKGKIEIEYYSQDELERIMEMMNRIQ
ncbi:MAG: ParB/RepB/Spo0J family partition protein [Lachnospiraceae bacterium]|nr:ParB/RepB/Spo0J family partition protein [Lachnospiraceae bacterium]